MQEPREGGADGFEAFFRANYPTALRIANGVVRDSHLAQDVAQDAFISTQRRFRDLGTSSDAVGWLRAATVHLGLNALRGERRRAARELRGVVERAPELPEDVVVGREEDEAVRRALRRLPRHAATVLVLRHSGLAYAEVADAMGVKVGHVGTMLRRAERALRKEVERATRA